MRKLIFIVDRDFSFSLLASAECEKYGYSACAFTTLHDVIERAETEHPDLFILNAEERTSEGLRLYDALRRNKCVCLTPIILLSDWSNEEQCIRCLEDGADDYVVKPVNFRELALRVRAVLNSSRGGLPLVIRIGSLEIDTIGMTVSIAGKLIPLTTREFRLLEFLARNPGHPYARKELLRVVWANANSATPRTVDSHVWRLRKKIEPTPTSPIYLHTIHNIGYSLALPYPGTESSSELVRNIH